MSLDPKDRDILVDIKDVLVDAVDDIDTVLQRRNAQPENVPALGEWFTYCGMLRRYVRTPDKKLAVEAEGNPYLMNAYTLVTPGECMFRGQPMTAFPS